MSPRCFEVRKDDTSRTRWTTDAPRPLADGQVRCAVGLCALTANNVTYAVMGERFGYWSYYPAEAGWGRVPVWGFAEVTESQAEGIDVGERLYGYWPMGTEAVLTPGKVSEARFSDASPHREGLPQVYNDYVRLRADPTYDRGKEAYRALFYPLAGTSYGLADWAEREGYKGAERVLCTAASSKTAIGTAMLLREREGAPPVVGLTSARNEAVTTRIGAYDEVLTYDALGGLDPAVPTLIIDMAGDGALSARLHRHLGERMVSNLVVGAAHPDAKRRAPGMNDARTELFFMPGYAAERMKETGGGFASDMMAAAGRVAARAEGWMRLVEADTEEGVTDLWNRVRGGDLAPDEGGIIRAGGQ